MMQCKYQQSALFRVALARWFIYRVMILGKLHDHNVFVKHSHMFAKWSELVINLYYVSVSQYCL